MGAYLGSYPIPEDIKISEEQKKELLKSISKSKELSIKDMVCDITKVFTNITVLSKGTASESIQVLATIPDGGRSILRAFMNEKDSDDVFIKIGFQAPGDNAAIVESVIYKYLSELIFERRTPNIMRFIMSFECTNFMDVMSYKRPSAHPAAAKIVETLMKMEADSGGNIDPENATFIVMERGRGKPFAELLGGPSGGAAAALGDLEFINVMFQTYYTLNEMALAGVRHNDLHLTNIWINILPVYTTLIYFVTDDIYFLVYTRYLVKIYDFDRADLTLPGASIKNNILATDFCPHYGMCGNENPYFDPHTVAYLLNELSGKTPAMEKFVHAVVPDPSFLEPGCCKFQGRMCQNTLSGVCSPTYVPGPGTIRNFPKLWRETDVFDILKNSLVDGNFDAADIPTDKRLRSTDVPDFKFKTNVYISQTCPKTPIQMANLLIKYKA